MGGPGQVGHRERLGIVRIGQFLGAQQMTNGRDRGHPISMSSLNLLAGSALCRKRPV